MSKKEIQRRVEEMQKEAAEYTARTGLPVNPTFLAAMQTQGSITILNPSILRWGTCATKMPLISSDEKFPYYVKQGLDLIQNHK